VIGLLPHLRDDVEAELLLTVAGALDARPRHVHFQERLEARIVFLVVVATEDEPHEERTDDEERSMHILSLITARARGD
jgi:hypothetical protein